MNKCIVCDSNDYLILKTDNKYSFLKCNKCDLLIVDPIPQELFKEKDRDEFFSDFNWAGSSRDVFNKEVLVANDKLERRLQFIKKIDFRNIHNVLEIGAGLGAWSAAFKKRNINYLGIEIDKMAVHAGQKFGANLMLGDFVSPDMDISSLGKYDMIFTSQVFEHIMKPHFFLERINNLLNEGGILYLDVPNPHGLIPQLKRIKFLKLENKKFERDYLNLQPPWHYLSYPDNTLRYILESHGFTIKYFAHHSFSNPTFGQLGDYKPFVKIINMLLDLMKAGSMTVVIGKKEH